MTFCGVTVTPSICLECRPRGDIASPPEVTAQQQPLLRKTWLVDLPPDLGSPPVLSLGQDHWPGLNSSLDPQMCCSVPGGLLCFTESQTQAVPGLWSACDTWRGHLACKLGLAACIVTFLHRGTLPGAASLFKLQLGGAPWSAGPSAGREVCLVTLNPHLKGPRCAHRKCHETLVT